MSAVQLAGAVALGALGWAALVAVFVWLIPYMLWIGATLLALAGVLP